jgi:hypothetical protein
VRGLSPLLQRCPTSTLGSKSSDSFPRSSTGVGISGDEINYRGVNLPLPQPFLIRPCGLILSIRRCAEAIYHPSTLSILGDGGMLGGAFSGVKRTNHPCTNGFRGQSVAIFYGIQRVRPTSSAKMRTRTHHAVDLQMVRTSSHKTP